VGWAHGKHRSILPSWQILGLAISGIIGVTIWQGNGLVLHIAGPAGLLTAVGFVGVTSISVMESLSEMIILWPVSMGLYEYVRAFVDHDLAIVIALAYW
jgi:yeast amino acid transporter